MHARDATRNILDKALRQAAERHAGLITGVYVVMGAISGYSEERISFYWSEISSGTIADGSGLRIRKVEAELQCMTCFTTYRPVDDVIECPLCGSKGAKILAGDEFYLEHLDVE